MSVPSMDSLLREAKTFCKTMYEELGASGFLQSAALIDHACYRVTSVHEYERLKTEIASAATLLSETYINSRPIATFRLRNPIVLNADYSVELLELPAPKPGYNFTRGFEHVEVVTNISLEEFLNVHSATLFDLRNFRAAINRDVSVRLKSGLVKFHEQSLEQIIEQEQGQLSEKFGNSRVAIVDFDDTIVASRDLFLRAIQEALEVHLGEKISYGSVCDLARPTFPQFFANFGIVGKEEVIRVIHLFQLAWQKQVSNCEIPTGVSSMLSCLKSEGFRVIIWTARDEETTTEFLASSNLLTYVDQIFAFDASSGGKPIPSSALLQAVEGCRGFVIGDSDSDLEGARRLGFPFLQATWVHSKKLKSDGYFTCSEPFDALRQIFKIEGEDRLVMSTKSKQDPIGR